MTSTELLQLVIATVSLLVELFLQNGQSFATRSNNTERLREIELFKFHQLQRT